LVSAPAPVRREALQVAAKLGISEVVPVLLELYADRSQTPSARAEALSALASLRYDKLEEVTRAAFEDEEPELRAAGRDVLARVRPDAALPLLRDASTHGDLVERQRALAALAGMKSAEADKLLAESLEKLLAGGVPDDTRLDVLAAARSRQTDSLKELLARYEQSLPQDDALAAHRPALVGGNKNRGREVFRRAETSCVRCHKVQGVGGDVGPDLSRIAADKDRAYLLESVVIPNNTIAKDFESVLLITDDGKVHSGIIRQEDAKNVRIVTAEGNIVTVAKDTIEERRVGKSAMPDDLTKHITPLELRDLVEYLSTLK
jgi:quinoprotein glucose dehydrogenase